MTFTVYYILKRFWPWKLILHDRKQANIDLPFSLEDSVLNSANNSIHSYLHSGI